jgi:GDP-L-fucose synthase
MSKNPERIFVAGHEGLAGAAIVRLLATNASDHEVITRTASQLDLGSQADTRGFLDQVRPTQIYMSVGDMAPPDHGLPAQSDNPLLGALTKSITLIAEAHRAGVKRLILIGGSSVYPMDTPAPLAEEDWLCGKLHPKKQGTAIAVTAALELCESLNETALPSGRHGYRCLISATPFGPVPGQSTTSDPIVTQLFRLLHTAKLQGLPQLRLPLSEHGRLDLICASDLAAAALHVMQLEPSAYAQVTAPSRRFLNVSHGMDIGHQDLAHKLAVIVGYRGKLLFEPTTGQAGRSYRLDNFRLRSLGWRPKLGMEDALALAYLDFLSRERKQAVCLASG